MPRVRPPRSTIALPPNVRQQLEERGARSDKARGPHNFTSQVDRTLALYDSLLLKSDPRQTQSMPRDVYELVLDQLTDPLALETFHIAHLGDYLAELPALRVQARELRLDLQQLRDTLNAYPYAEKLHLVDAAQVRHAPRQRKR
jgi:hypothetical protein